MNCLQPNQSSFNDAITLSKAVYTDFGPHDFHSFLSSRNYFNTLNNAEKIKSNLYQIMLVMEEAIYNIL